MSAIEESNDGPIEVIKVLFALHPSFGAQELCGPLEVLTNARHKINDPGNCCLLFAIIVFMLSVFIRYMRRELILS